MSRLDGFSRYTRGSKPHLQLITWAKRLGNRLRGEEIAVFKAMTRDGLEGRWSPGAKVQHFIPKGRQTKKYLRPYYRVLGVLDALNMAQEGQDLLSIDSSICPL